MNQDQNQSDPQKPEKQEDQVVPINRKRLKSKVELKQKRSMLAPKCQVELMKFMYMTDRRSVKTKNSFDCIALKSMPKNSKHWPAYRLP